MRSTPEIYLDEDNFSLNTCGSDSNDSTPNTVSVTVIQNNTSDGLGKLTIQAGSADGDIGFDTIGTLETDATMGSHTVVWSSTIPETTVNIYAEHPGNDDVLPLSSTIVASLTFTKQTPVLSTMPTVNVDQIDDTQNLAVTIDAPFAAESVIYTTDNPSVATIDATGLMTIVGTGSTIAHATVAATDCHHQAVESSTITTANPTLNIQSVGSASLTKSSTPGDAEGPSTSVGVSVTKTNITGLNFSVAATNRDSWEMSFNDLTWSPINDTVQTDGGADDFAGLKFRIKTSSSHTSGAKDLTLTFNSDQGVSDTVIIPGTIVPADAVTLNWSTASSTVGGYEEGNGPGSMSSNLTLTGNNLYSSAVTVIFSGANAADFEWSSNNGTDWYSNNSLQYDDINNGKSLNVRLKAGLEPGTYTAGLVATTSDLNDDGSAVVGPSVVLTATVTAASLNAGEVQLSTSTGQLDFTDVQSFVDAGQTTFQREYTFYNQSDAARWADDGAIDDDSWASYSELADASGDPITDTVTAVVKVDLKSVGDTSNMYTGAGGDYPGTETIYNASQRDTVTAGGWSDSLVNWTSANWTPNIGYAIDVDGSDFITGITLKDSIAVNQTIADSSTITAWSGITSLSVLSISVKYYITSTVEEDYDTPATGTYTTERSTSGYTRDSYNTLDEESSLSDTFALAV